MARLKAGVGVQGPEVAEHLDLGIRVDVVKILVFHSLAVGPLSPSVSLSVKWDDATCLPTLL